MYGSLAQRQRSAVNDDVRQMRAADLETLETFVALALEVENVDAGGRRGEISDAGDHTAALRIKSSFLATQRRDIAAASSEGSRSTKISSSDAALFFWAISLRRLSICPRRFAADISTAEACCSIDIVMTQSMSEIRQRGRRD